VQHTKNDNKQNQIQNVGKRGNEAARQRGKIINYKDFEFF
jgi:hypothetical protein